MLSSLFKTIQSLFSANRDLALFFLGNLIFSTSTFLLNAFTPYLMGDAVYDEFVYSVQIIILINGLVTTGLVYSLLRSHQLNSGNFLNYYLWVILFCIILSVLAFNPNNYISTSVSLNSLSKNEHLIFYASVVLTSLFLFNRGTSNAKKSFKSFLIQCSIVFLIRMLGLLLLGIWDFKLDQALFLFFVAPFAFEPIVFVRNLFATFRKQMGRFKAQNFFRFLLFGIKVAASGIFFLLADKYFLICIKDIDTSFTTVLSFAFGFTGIVTIINLSISQYFLGKLNPNKPNQIKLYLKKVNKTVPVFIFLTLILTIIFAFSIRLFYPQFEWQAPIVFAILMIKMAFLSGFGWINVLAKTLDLVNYEILVNAIRFVLIVVLINFFLTKDYFLLILIISCLIMIFGEWLLTRIIRMNLKKGL